MKKLFEFVRKISTQELNQKFIMKVTAGVLLLAVAFAVYLGKMKHEEQGNMDVIIPSQTRDEIEEKPEKKELSKKDMLIFVDVTGAVEKPSVVKLPDGSRVFEAIELAGGIRSDGDTKYLNLAARLTDGTQIYVSTKNEVSEREKSNIKGVNNMGSNVNSNANEMQPYTNTANVSSNHGLININTADSKELQNLTGLGPSTAEKIISYRNSFGSFEKIEDLKNVSGIGDKTFEKLRDKICIN